MTQETLLQKIALESALWPLEFKAQLPSQVPSFEKPPYFGLASNVIQRLLRVFLLHSENTERQYAREVQRIVQETVAQIKTKRNYAFFIDFIHAIEAKFDISWFDLVPHFFRKQPTFPILLVKTLVAIWILLDKEGRWPVVVRNGQFSRKRIEVPQNPETALDHLTFVGTQILTVLPFLDSQDLDLVPDQFVGPAKEGSPTSISVPAPLSPVEETLEEAYFNQHFYLHPVGAAVKVRGGRDVTGAFLNVKDGVVISRFHTLKGEMLCLLNLEAAKGVQFPQIIQGPKDSFVRILANVYHALVVAKEKPSPGRHRVEEVPLAVSYPLADTEEHLSISYVPRTVYVGGKQESSAPRIAAEFRRSPRPHPVRPHSSWRGPISAHQRSLVEEFERATGLKILDKLPPGKTFVLPHFSPKLEPGEIAQLPLFIKKGIEAEITRPLAQS